MQGFAIIGLAIVSAIFYVAVTAAVSVIVFWVDSDHETSDIAAWIFGGVCFTVIVLLWATKPFPVSMG